MMAGTWEIFAVTQNRNYHKVSYLDVFRISLLGERTLQERSYRDGVGESSVHSVPGGMRENVGSARAAVGREVRISEGERSLVLLGLADTLCMTGIGPTSTLRHLVRSRRVVLPH